MSNVRPLRVTAPLMPINIAKEIAHCVRQMRGVVLDDVLKSPDFENADYWFANAGVVAELKCLTEDLASKPNYTEALSKLYASWVRRGLVTPPKPGRVSVNLRDIPIRCAREFLDPIKRKLEASTIKKANRQIRATKKYLDAPDAKGLLLLANDGNYMFPPNMMAYLLGRILNGQHSSIHSIVYFSANLEVAVPGVQLPSYFWIDAIAPGREPVALAFRRELRATWMAHHSSLVPGPLYEIEGRTDGEYLDSITFTDRAAV